MSDKELLDKLLESVEKVSGAWGQPCDRFEHPDDFIDFLAEPLNELEMMYQVIIAHRMEEVDDRSEPEEIATTASTENIERSMEVETS